MNMFLHELKAYRKSTIVWTCVLVAVSILFLSLFPSFSKDVAEFNKILESFPEGVRKALGISIDTISTFIGFYSYVFLYIVLCGSIQAMNLGVSILSKEVREKTADFLLTKPVTRMQVVTSKLLAALASLIITNVIYIAATTIVGLAVAEGTFDFKIFFMISITGFFVQLMFLSLGVIISVLVPKIKSVLPISLSTVFGFFIISMFGSVIGDNAIRYITPFKYFDTAYIIKNSAYEASFIIIEILFIGITTAISYLIYSKKDIHAV
ncbi:ABC transporter permease subunit [Clostridium sp. Marseille-QA1073]